MTKPPSDFKVSLTANQVEDGAIEYLTYTCGSCASQASNLNNPCNLLVYFPLEQVQELRIPSCFYFFCTCISFFSCAKLTCHRSSGCTANRCLAATSPATSARGFLCDDDKPTGTSNLLLLEAEKHPASSLGIYVRLSPLIMTKSVYNDLPGWPTMDVA